MEEHGRFIVYVDESGNHGLDKPDPQFPLFVLAFCIFEKPIYAHEVIPALIRFKFEQFGHDQIVLHEREIRKQELEFSCLRDATRREPFMEGLNQIIGESNFTLIASVIWVDLFRQTKKIDELANPYHVALKCGLSRVCKFLDSHNQCDKCTHMIFEARGKKENDALELEFRRFCDGDNCHGKAFPFQIKFAHKQINSCGLQLADLVARPIGRKLMKPQQKNRAYDVLEKKFFHDGSGDFLGWGLQTHPHGPAASSQ